MYMDGFQAGGDPNSPCLLFLIKPLVIDTPWKMGVACIFTVILSAGVECCCAVRACAQRKGRQVLAKAARKGRGGPHAHAHTHANTHAHTHAHAHAHGNAHGNAGRGRGARTVHALALEAVLASLFAAQALVSYLLMLVAMTFRVELLASVIVGLTIGKTLLGDRERVASPEPCCNLAASSEGGLGEIGGGLGGGGVRRTESEMRDMSEVTHTAMQDAAADVDRTESERLLDAGVGAGMARGGPVAP